MLDVTKIKAKRDVVIVEMIIDESVLSMENMSTEEKIAVRRGKVIDIGDKVDTHDSCKNLKVGDIVYFTEFAGYYIPTDDGKLYKAMIGYDIIGKMKEKDMDIKNLIPTSNRLLVEIVSGADSTLFSDIKDPRVSTLSYGKVIAIGDSVKTLDVKVGDTVAFPPYTGVIVQEHESIDIREMRTVVEFDILFVVKI